MTNFTELIMSRRSVRRYKEAQIPEESLQAIIKAGIYAPNGGNLQLWHFTVLQNQNTLKELNGLIRKAFAKNADSENRFLRKGAAAAKNDNYRFYYGAPTVILVSGDVTNPNAMADCACANENMILTAHAQGIGSVYINAPTWNDGDPEVRELLTRIGVPPNYHVCASSAFGYSDAPPVKAIRNEDVVNYVR
jgi:nitroreductase